MRGSFKNEEIDVGGGEAAVAEKKDGNQSNAEFSMTQGNYQV
jgi:hypothetical protein